MEKQPFWIVVLGLASVANFVTALITLYQVHRQKDLDFVYDYRKYILDKRKAVYNDVENLLKEFGAVIHKEGRMVLKIFVPTEADRHPLNTFNTEVVKVSANAFWITPHLSEVFEVLIAQLKADIIFLREHDQTEGVALALEAARQKRYDGILTLMIGRYFDDIKRLDKVDAFFRERSQQPHPAITFVLDVYQMI